MNSSQMYAAAFALGGFLIGRKTKLFSSLVRGPSPVVVHVTEAPDPVPAAGEDIAVMSDFVAVPEALK
jgi:hypothetical protein